jgi:hypothetical protein
MLKASVPNRLGLNQFNFKKLKRKGFIVEYNTKFKMMNDDEELYSVMSGVAAAILAAAEQDAEREAEEAKANAAAELAKILKELDGL